MASSQPTFTFSLTFQSGQSERTRLFDGIILSCHLRVNEYVIDMRASVDESETPAFLHWPVPCRHQCTMGNLG